MRWSLNVKLIVMMLCLSAILVLSMLALNIYYEDMLMNALERTTVELAEAIHLAIQEIMQSEEKDYMKLYYKLKELQPEGLKEINIIDGATRIRASTNPFKVGQTTPEEITELIFQSELGQFVTKQDNLYHIVLPVVVKGEHQGYIHTVVSGEEVLRLIRTNTRNRLIVTLMVFAIGVVVAVWLSNRYTRPIKEVVESVKAVASGDLDVRLDVREKDEIGVLKKSFNEMAERLLEMRRLEERLREAEHLSTIGEISRSIAHELRNPLNFLNLTVDHLLSKRDINSETGQLLKSMKEEIKRLDRIVNNFLAYGRPLRIQKSPVQVKRLLQDCVRLIHAKAEKLGVEVREDYKVDDNLCLMVDPELIKTSLLNVFQNALQAMPGGGLLKVKVSETDSAIVIEVADTGIGVDRELLERVFEPFFTTKADGMGLGLAMTKKVVEEHGGTIQFRSEKSRGSVVIIRLPV